MHGRYLTYCKLIIPEIPEKKRVLYLDSDTLVKCNLREIEKLSMGEKVIGAVSSGKVKNKIDKKLVKSFAKSDETYYNAGVLIFNSKKWKKDNGKEFIHYLEYTNDDERYKFVQEMRKNLIQKWETINQTEYQNDDDFRFEFSKDY